MIRDLTPTEWTRMRWMQLYLRLPASGVEKYFPDEASCADRVKQVRWPGGMRCTKCDADRLKTCHSRKTLRCLKCAHEFSLKFGTVMARSRHSLRQWFLAAEEHVSLCATGRDRVDTGHEFAARLGVAYTTAFRFRKKLERELESDNSLLISIICVEELSLPQDFARDDRSAFNWLDDVVSEHAARKRRG